MGKNQSASNLTNVIQVSSTGNVLFVSGSTTLMSISSSGAITTTGVISGSNALSASYAANADTLDGLDSTVFTLTSSFNAQTASFTAFTASILAQTASLNAFSASILSYTSSANNRFSSIETVTGSNITRLGALESYTSSLNDKTSSFATTGSNNFIGTQTISGSVLQSGSFTSTGTLTAQTLVVQTITSSVVYSSGSNIFGNAIANTQTFTGSVLITGSLTIAGASSATSYSGSTIYGSTVVCSPVGCFGILCGDSIFSSYISPGGQTSIRGVENRLGIGTANPLGVLSITGGQNSLASLATYSSIEPLGIFNMFYINSGTYPFYLDIAAYGDPQGSTGESNIRFLTHPSTLDATPTERMRITSTGAIGIGTTNPINFFEAYSNSTTNLAYFTTSGSANRMIIGATNVGNGSLIDVRAHGSVYTESIFGMCATNTAAVIGAPASGCAMLVGTIVNSPIVFGTCNIERMRIANTGAATFTCGVSVNGLAVSANYKLGATGAAFISGTNSKGIFITDSATYASIVGLNSAISTYNKLELRASGTDGQIMLHTNGNVSIGNPTDTGDQLYLAGNLKMTTNGKIDSNGGYLLINSATGGSVGIGNTPANAKLLVYDTGCTVSLGISCFYNQARGIDLVNANSGTTDNVVGLWISTGPHKAGIASGRTNAASTWEVDLRFYTHPTATNSLDTTCENMRLYGDGSLVTRGGASSPGLYSDINLKENLSIIPSALNKIKCINGYTFDWKDTAPARSNPDLLNIIHDAGLIAQEVEEILPDIVRENSLSCIKMLNYNGIIALLVEGMKEQQCTINTLKTCLGIS